MGQQHSQIKSCSNLNRRNGEQQNQRYQFKHLRPQLLSQHEKSYNRKSVGKIRTKQVNNISKKQISSPINNQEQPHGRQRCHLKQRQQLESKINNPTLSIQVNEEENEQQVQQTQKARQNQTSQNHKIAGLVRFSKSRFQKSRKVSLANGSILYIEAGFFDSSTRTLAEIVQSRLQDSDEQISKRHKILPQRDIQNMIESLSTTLSLLEEAGIHYFGFNFKSKSSFRQIFKWMQKIVIFNSGQIKLIPNQLLLLNRRNYKQQSLKYQPIGETIQEQLTSESTLRKLGILILRVCYLTLTGTVIQQDSEIVQNKQHQLTIQIQLNRVCQYYDEELIKFVKRMIFSKCNAKQFKNWLQKNKSCRDQPEDKNRKTHNGISDSQTTNRISHKNSVQIKKESYHHQPKPQQYLKQKTTEYPKSIQRFKQYSPRKYTEEAQRYYALRQRISKSPFKNYQKQKNKVSDQYPSQETTQRSRSTKHKKSSSQFDHKLKPQASNYQRNKQHKTNQVYFKRQHLLSEKSEGSKSKLKSPKDNKNQRYAYLDHQTQIYLKSIQKKNNSSKRNPDLKGNYLDSKQVSPQQSQRLKRIQYNLDNRIKMSNELFKNNRLSENCERNRNQREYIRKDKIKYDYDFKMVNQGNQDEHQYRLRKQHLYNRPTEGVYKMQSRLQQKKNGSYRLLQKQQIKNKEVAMDIPTEQLKRQKSCKMLRVQQNDQNDFSQHSYQKHQIEVPSCNRSNNEYHAQGTNQIDRFSKIDKNSQNASQFYYKQSQNFERDFSPNFKDGVQPLGLHLQNLHFHSQSAQQDSDGEHNKQKNQLYVIRQKQNNLKEQHNKISKIKAQIARSKKLIDGIKQQRQTETKVPRKERRQLKQNFIGF